MILLKDFFFFLPRETLCMLFASYKFSLWKAFFVLGEGGTYFYAGNKYFRIRRRCLGRRKFSPKEAVFCPGKKG